MQKYGKHQYVPTFILIFLVSRNLRNLHYKVPSKKRGPTGVYNNYDLIMKIIYNPKLKDYARHLRNNSTNAEIKLWMQLKGKQMHGYDFHRQKPIENYIADFFL
jgi:hypothetical protein